MAFIRGTAGSVDFNAASDNIQAGSSVGVWKGPALRGLNGADLGGEDGGVAPHAPRGILDTPAVEGRQASVVLGRKILSVDKGSTGLKYKLS